MTTVPNPVPAQSTRAAATTTDVLLSRFQAACDAPAVPESGGSEAVHHDSLPDRQCRAAADVLAVDAVEISIMIDGRKRVPLGASSPAATTAESLEFTLGEGPSLSAHTHDAPVLVPDLTDHWAPVWSDWATYGEELCARTPYRAVFAFPLSREGLTLGTISLYRELPGELSSDEMARAMAVADQVFDDLLDSGMFDHDAAPLSRWLDLPLARGRGTLWRAVGVTTVELSMSSADALALLRAYSYSHNLLLDDVAADVISRQLPPAVLAA